MPYGGPQVSLNDSKRHIQKPCSKPTPKTLLKAKLTVQAY